MVAQVKTLAQEAGVRFLSVGFDPKSAKEAVPIMPKARYDIMRAYMPTVGTLGLDMMLRSCTIQARTHTHTHTHSPPPPPAPSPSCLPSHEMPWVDALMIDTHIGVMPSRG